MLKRQLFILALLVVGLLTIGQPVTTSADEPTDSTIVPNHYIVVLKDNAAKDQDSVRATADDLYRKDDSVAEFEYSGTVKGFSATIPQNKLKQLQRDKRVKAVVPDHYVFASPIHHSSPSILSQTLPTGVKRIGADTNANKGAGVTVAVIDTGIDLTHPDLASKIVAQKTCVHKTSANDDNGHGTHVAGTIAALDNAVGVVGVAPGANLIAVKTLNQNGSGTWSSIICGIDWVTQNANQYNIKVANMSLGGGGSSDNNCGNTNNDPLHQAICRSRDAGVTYIVAAGNSKQDASSTVPAAYDDAVITVSALADSDGTSGATGTKTSYGTDDTFATFSNYGSVVDVGAPGVNIFSTYKSGGYATMSGTSMATPHVAGAAALYLADHGGANWTTVRDALKSMGESLGDGHTDPSGRHPEPVVKADNL